MSCRLIIITAASGWLAACGGSDNSPVDSTGTATPPPTVTSNGTDGATLQNADFENLDEQAEAFVKIALAIGVHDGAFVDAYHGPAEWRDEANLAATPIHEIEDEAEALLIRVARINADTPSIRGAMLEKNVRAALARMQIVQGENYHFNEETRLLYDAVAPEYDVNDFYAALAQIEELLPGDAPLHERVDAFRNSLAIPVDRLSDVFNAAIEECRARTLARYTLPENERFRIEFVKDKPWGGYNWYQGDYESLIQVNTDLPIIIDRAVDLGCHEGYPGHHTWNVLLERDVLKGAGWIEYSVYPLFSPLSITAEGSANFGIELAFPGDEKIKFEKDVLFPLAGLDSAKAEKLAALNNARRKLSHARNHIARLYLDGSIDREEAVRMAMEFRLESRERAEKSVDFIETYRGYVINYNLGRDLVEDFVRRRAIGDVDEWTAYETLLTTPLAASDIKVR